MNEPQSHRDAEILNVFLMIYGRLLKDEPFYVILDKPGVKVDQQSYALAKDENEVQRLQSLLFQELIIADNAKVRRLWTPINYFPRGG